MDTILYGMPGAADAQPEASSGDHPIVREVGAAEAGQVQSLYVDGFEFPPGDRDFARGYLPRQVDNPNNHMFVAELDGAPVAMGLLWVHDRIAYLAGGATLRAQRNRGCQTALLHHGSAVAAAMGCELLVSRTGVSTGSQHNMERLGLRLAGQILHWAPPP